jgi:pyruvate-ferredoxin/flavodoxin oxidoreductase
MTTRPKVTIDGNEAAAYVAYHAGEVVAIYPINSFVAYGRIGGSVGCRKIPNVWGNVPRVIEMQSEGGAAGAMHGALQAWGPQPWYSPTASTSRTLIWKTWR